MHGSGQSQRFVRSMVWLAWLLLPIFAISCLSVKYAWDIKHQSAVVVYQQQEVKHQQKCGRIRKNLFALGLNGQHYDVVMARLNLPDDVRLDEYPSGYRFSREIDYLEGSQIVLIFNPNDTLEGLTVFDPSFDLPYPNKPMARTQADIERFADSLLNNPLPIMIWFFLVVLYVTTHHQSFFLWLICAWITFCMAVSLLSPKHLLIDESIIENTWLIWPVVMLCGLGAVIFLRRHIFRVRDPLACKHCGYNLTGNTSGKCPECGGVVQAAGQRPDGRVG